MTRPTLSAEAWKKGSQVSTSERRVEENEEGKTMRRGDEDIELSFRLLELWGVGTRDGSGGGFIPVFQKRGMQKLQQKSRIHK
jgi:hypothetical protein